MMIAAERRRLFFEERQAWRCYFLYVREKVHQGNSTFVFKGDEASHGLYAEWRAAYEGRSLPLR